MTESKTLNLNAMLYSIKVIQTIGDFFKI